MKVVDNIVVGKPDVKVTTPSHVRGVHEGNRPYRMRRRARARERETTLPEEGRSTGINAEHRAPILPDMPKLSPP